MENHKGTNQPGIFFMVWGAANSSSEETRERTGGSRGTEAPIVTGLEGQVKECRCFPGDGCFSEISPAVAFAGVQ